MRRLIFFPALLLVLNAFPKVANGQTAATTTLTASPTTITVGSSVGLAAIVQPINAPGGGKTIPRPSGTITFLDGSTLLSSAPIALGPHGIASATFPQSVGMPDPSLVAGELVGDLNGDGVQDLLLYNTDPFSAQIFTSNGKGGYNASSVQTFGLTACSSFVYVSGSPQLADLNGDGKPDNLSGTMVAYGNGDGTFAQATPLSFLSSGFYTSYTADLNGDGKPDILAVPNDRQSDFRISAVCDHRLLPSPLWASTPSLYLIQGMATPRSPRHRLPRGQRRVHSSAGRWRQHYADSQRRSDSEHTHQRERCIRILWPGHLCMLRSAGEYQLHL